MELKVIKRDGSKEPFEEEKIARVAQAAGLSTDQAAVLAHKVWDTLIQGKNSEVTSLHVRNLVSKELHEVDEFAANLFDWYQKVKENDKE